MEEGHARIRSAESLRIWRGVHKWTSLVCTLFVLMLCITGLPLIFRDEIDDLIYDDVHAPELTAQQVAQLPPVSLDRIVAAGRKRYPGRYVRTLFWDDDDPNIIKLSIVPSPEAPSATVRRLAFDARTGEYLGAPQIRRGVTSFLLGLHRDMLSGLSGTLFLGLMGVVFLAAIVSGVVLYAPFMRGRPFGAVRRDRSPRTKWLDLHNLFGIVTLVWALVVGATGALNTLAVPLTTLWRAQAMPALLEPHLNKPPLTGFGSVDAAVDAAKQALPDRKVASVVFPNARFGSPRHYLVWTKGDMPLTARLFTPVLIDAETGAASQALTRPWYLRLIEISRPLHFGDYGGMPLKVVWALFDILTILVLLSGLYLWATHGRIARRHASG